MQPRVMQHCFRVIHYDLGIKELDYHSLRHTHTTMLLNEGANVKMVQERLGHKKVEITLEIYNHVTDKMRKDAIEILNKKRAI
ncbi:MAG: tyrosine-type recombinase/integrase [Clostridium sp.]|uniref:tyrosine-type recombinase/integrase n=1 Tax=Clostridium sp. TaxID=1506 RepID=UPI002910FBD2|nr:tyrosine-type recombinase/integrase [Clostridium sp.]